MIFIKIYFHIICFIEKFIFKLLYGNHVKFGKRTTFRKRFNLIVESKGCVEIGSDCFFNNDCSISCIYKIKIGAGTLFGENVKIYDHNHRFSDINKPIKKQGYTYSEIIVGNHCWIGSNVVLLKGCNIGDNCVIGAGCIIAENIPSNTIVKSNQGKVFLAKKQ